MVVLSHNEELLPGLRLLDFTEVAKLGAERLPSLKAIEPHVGRQLPGVSRQTLANALAAAGLRRPRSGPRSRKADLAAFSPQSG